MILHSFPFSQHGRRVVALLEESGLSYELRPVDLSKGQHRTPAFLALNPSGQIPVLEDGGLVLSESNAILRHICRSRGLDAWMPPERAAPVDQWLDWNLARLSLPTMRLAQNRFFKRGTVSDAQAEEAEAMLAPAAAVLEAALEGRDWIAGGPHPSIADLSLVSNLQQLSLAGARPTGPATQAWYARTSALPGVARSLPEVMRELCAP